MHAGRRGAGPFAGGGFVVDRSCDVSVIMAVYNGMPFLDRALDSLRVQTLGLERMQVLIVDDGSTDSTPEVLDRAAAECPYFEVIHQANAGGPAAPRNLALQHVRGRYVFFLDADDWIADDTLRAMVAVADANATDVVLARVKGVGGRNAPNGMYARTLPRTDVFTSAAYWTLNPMKMFRTELIRSQGLTFPLGFPWGEDLPFVARAMFAAHGISILADRDYVFWALREDRANIIKRAVTLADRMPAADLMFDLLADHVPPGSARDRLMCRHFAVEFRSSAFSAYRRESDPAARAAAFQRFREITDAYYTPLIEARLQPEARVLMRLVSEGDEAQFAGYLDALSQAGAPEVVTESDAVYLAFPWFSDAGHPLPDELFEIGKRLRAECRMEPLKVDAAGMHISATCRLGALTAGVDEVALVLRRRGAGHELALPLAHLALVEGTRQMVGIGETIPAERLAAELRDGMYDLFLRLDAGETRRECRVAECALPPRAARIASFGSISGHGVSLALTTTDKGNLSARVVRGDGALARTRLAVGLRVRAAAHPLVRLARRVSRRVLPRRRRLMD